MTRPRRITALAERGFEPIRGLRFPYARMMTTSLVKAALEEDGAANDITSIATVVSDRRARSTIVAREAGVIAGIPLVREAFRQRDPNVSVRSTIQGWTAGAGRHAHNLHHRSRPRNALGGARRAQLRAAPVGDRLSHGEIRRRRRRHGHKNPRYAQDNSGMAAAGEVRRPRRRRVEPPDGLVSGGADQGQSSGSTWRRCRARRAARAQDRAAAHGRGGRVQQSGAGALRRRRGS